MEMENTANDVWYYVLNGFHYLFLVALLVLIGVYLVRMFRGKSKDSKEIHSHSRSKRH